MECPDRNEAIARQRRLLAGRTELLGPEHERTLRTRFVSGFRTVARCPVFGQSPASAVGGPATKPY